MESSRQTATVGFYTAAATAVLTAVTFGMAVTTLPLSGPYCEAERCFTYPYADIGSRFPRDYLWMYPAMVLSLLYMGLAACVYEFAAPAKRIFGLFGLAAALLAGGTLVLDYFVQVAVVQPSLLAGETDGIAILTQFNPHGVFIALEEAGYIMMAVSFLFMAPVFSGAGKAERGLRLLLIAGFLLMAAAYLYYSVVYGLTREYRFEVAVISIDWIVLLAGSVLMAMVFRRASRQQG